MGCMTYIRIGSSPSCLAVEEGESQVLYPFDSGPLVIVTWQVFSQIGRGGDWHAVCALQVDDGRGVLLFDWTHSPGLLLASH